MSFLPDAALLPTLALPEAWTSYAALDPILTNLALLGFFISSTFVVSTYTGNYSQVDRLWSITPFVYVWNTLLVGLARGYAPDPRLCVMAVLSTVWGARLTYNFARKGGYSAGEEDYRWPALRKMITNPILWHAFALSFISAYQNILLVLIAMPSCVAFRRWEMAEEGVASGAGWCWVDTAATVAFVALLAIETVADQQQWAFQEKKWGMIKSGKKLEDLPVPYRYGFLTTGLFKYCRHPNFTAEFSMWWAFYAFSIGASGVVANWSILGPTLLTLLFQGSTAFTEMLTASKYPLYKIYQRHTPALFPLPPGEPLEAVIERESKIE
ncbi:hypothetical protein HK101_004112 [Irineochytrium annulatum]|nr:hypothetical protein HK101_004112 [Irineochytrium annulatum]